MKGTVTVVVVGRTITQLKKLTFLIHLIYRERVFFFQSDCVLVFTFCVSWRPRHILNEVSRPSFSQTSVKTLMHKLHRPTLVGKTRSPRDHSHFSSREHLTTVPTFEGMVEETGKVRSRKTQEKDRNEVTRSPSSRKDRVRRHKSRCSNYSFSRDVRKWCFRLRVSPVITTVSVFWFLVPGGQWTSRDWTTLGYMSQVPLSYISSTESTKLLSVQILRGEPVQRNFVSVYLGKYLYLLNRDTTTVQLIPLRLSFLQSYFILFSYLLVHCVSTLFVQSFLGKFCEKCFTLSVTVSLCLLLPFPCLCLSLCVPFSLFLCFHPQREPRD